MRREPFTLEADGADLEAVRFSPARTPRIGVVFAHGWSGAHRFDDLLERLAGRGIAGIRFSQRGYGESTGIAALERWPPDMNAAAALLEAEGIRVWMGGLSTGATMAIAACAANPRALGFFAIAPFLSLPAILRDNADAPTVLERRFGTLPAAAADAADARRHVRALGGRPGLVVHSRLDDTVPFAHGEEIARAGGPTVRLLALDRGNHVLSDVDRGPVFAGIEALLGLGPGSGPVEGNGR